MLKKFNWERMGSGMREGKRLEWDVLGRVNIHNPHYQSDLSEVRRAFPNKAPIREVMKFVARHQPEGWDPLNPPKEFLKELKLAIGDKLGFSEKELDGIKAYTSSESIADINDGQGYSFDAFITVKNPKNGKVGFVTYDLTGLDIEDKTARHPDTIIISDYVEPPIPDEETDNADAQEITKKYLAKVDEIAEFSAQQLRSHGI